MKRVVFAAAIICGLIHCTTAQDSIPARFSGFPNYAEFLNSDKNPRETPAFSDRLLILNFYTPDSRQCQDELTNLSRLSSFYPYAVLVGIANPKYPNDTLRGQMVHSIINQQIDYPVVFDKRFVLWDQMKIKKWPTTLLISENGKILKRVEGRGAAQALASPLDSIRKSEQGQNLRTTPINHKLARHKRPGNVLGYPDRIAADPANLKLFVSEPRFNRVAIVDQSGMILGSMGGVETGDKDGMFNIARFNSPTGLAYDSLNNRLFISDTRNHKIKVAELDSNKVRTILGNGKRSKEKTFKAVGTSHSINAPTGLLYHDKTLYICMAGSHEIWTYDPETGVAELLTGGFQMGFEDGKLEQALFAQPEGLAMGEDGTLYVADSENNAIRAIKDSTVTTIAGAGPFEYGDETGKLEEVRFQYPTELSIDEEGRLLIVDRYNHRIKALRSNGRKVDDFAGNGQAGFWLAPAYEAEMNQPADMVRLLDKWYLTDSNNGILRIYDPNTGRVGGLKLMELRNLETPISQRNAVMVDNGTIDLNPGKNSIELRVKLPGDYRFTQGAPHFAILKSKGEGSALDFSELGRGLLSITSDQSDEGSEFFIIDMLVYIQPRGLPEKQEYLRRTILMTTNIDGDAPTEHEIDVNIPGFK